MHWNNEAIKQQEKALDCEAKTYACLVLPALMQDTQALRHVREVVYSQKGGD